MANAGEIRAGKAYVEMGLDNAPLKKGLSESKSMLSGFSESVKGIFSGLKTAFSSLQEALAGNNIAGAVTAIFGGKLGGIATALVNLYEAFPELTKRAGAAFGQMGKDFAMTWEGMVAAVQASRLDLAFAVAVAEIKVIWADFMDWMKSTFPELGRLIESSVTGAQRGLARAIATTMDLIAGRRPGAPGSMLATIRQEQAGQDWMIANGLAPDAREELREAVRRARAARDAMNTELSDDMRRGARGTFSQAATAGLVGGLGIGQNPWLPRIGESARDAVVELQRLNRNVEEMRNNRQTFE